MARQTIETFADSRKNIETSYAHVVAPPYLCLNRMQIVCNSFHLLLSLGCTPAPAEDNVLCIRNIKKGEKMKNNIKSNINTITLT